MPLRHHVYFLLYPTPAAADCAAALWNRTRHRLATQKSVPMPPERLHTTLMPLGCFEDRVPDTVLNLALAAGGAVDDEPFELVFNVIRSRGGGPLGTVELAGHGPELCLVDSLHGQGRHEVLCRWPLRQRQQVFSGWEPDVPTNPRGN